MRLTVSYLKAFLLACGVLLSACENDRGIAEEPRMQDVPRQSLTESPVHGVRPVVQDRAQTPLEPLGPTSEAGANIYEFSCAICHGARGSGGVGPPLDAGNPNMQVGDYLVAQVLLGGGGMPPFAPRLTDAEIASVLTFVRSSWGNDAGAMSPQQVATQRSGLRPGLRLGPSTRTGDRAQDPGGLSVGEQVFVQQGCSGCHGASGGGGVGPRLTGNDRLAQDNYIIDQILHGGGGMPPFAQQLTDEEIAAVATHERTSWGNDFGPIESEQVMRRRAAEGQP